MSRLTILVCGFKFLETEGTLNVTMLQDITNDVHQRAPNLKQIIMCNMVGKSSHSFENCVKTFLETKGKFLKFAEIVKTEWKYENTIGLWFHVTVLNRYVDQVSC